MIILVRLRIILPIFGRRQRRLRKGDRLQLDKTGLAVVATRYAVRRSATLINDTRRYRGTSYSAYTRNIYCTY